MPNIIEGHYNKAPKNGRFVILVSRWNALVTQKLLEGAIDGLVRNGVDDANIDVVWVPGSFELALAAKKALTGNKYVAAIALGCVIRGATAHFDYVAGEATKGLGQVMLDSGKPIAFGVLTTDNLEQALERAGSKAGNKGFESATVVLEMVDLLSKLL